MKRELRILQWSLVGVILLIFFVPLDDPNEEIIEQWQDGLHDWYICRNHQCSVEPGAASSLPAQTARYRRHVSVTPTVPQETLVSRFHRSHQCCCLVPTLFPCISLVLIASTTQSGHIEQDPHSSNFQSYSEWFKCGGQNCHNDDDDVQGPAEGWNDVLFGPCCACAEWSGCLFDQFFICGPFSRRPLKQS